MDNKYSVSSVQNENSFHWVTHKSVQTQKKIFRIFVFETQIKVFNV